MECFYVPRSQTNAYYYFQNIWLLLNSFDQDKWSHCCWDSLCLLIPAKLLFIQSILLSSKWQIVFLTKQKKKKNNIKKLKRNVSRHFRDLQKAQDSTQPNCRKGVINSSRSHTEVRTNLIIISGLLLTVISIKRSRYMSYEIPIVRQHLILSELDSQLQNQQKHQRKQRTFQ